MDKNKKNETFKEETGKVLKIKKKKDKKKYYHWNCIC